MLPFFALSAQQPAAAGGAKIVGTIIDEQTKEALVGVNVQLRRMRDTSTLLKGAVSDIDGKFIFAEMAADTYQLKISYVGYDALLVNNLQLQPNITYPLDTLRLRTADAMIDIIQVEAVAIRVEMKGDTVQYNASAFKVNPDATVEDLVRKMPNVTIENGVVKAQGEEVKKVTIDGKEFFGDDASTALRNLPADIVDKIQVYDRSSDQAGFLGVSDGSERKALNIVTRTGKLTGNFGRFYAGYGYGDEHRYQAGGNFNNFDGDRRFSVLGMSNNVNQQNFGSEDLLGVMSGGGGGRGGGGRGGGGGGWGAPSSAVLEGAMSGQQRGISTSHALGINYNDKWGEKTTAALSYFGSYSQNTNLSSLSRFYFADAEAPTNQLYDETTSSNNNNVNHRLTARFEIKPDSMQSIIISPRLSWQQNSQRQDFFGLSQMSDLSFLSSTKTLSSGSGSAYTLGGSATYMRRLNKPRRSLSIDLSGNLNNRLQRRLQLADNLFAENIDSALLLNQFSRNYNNSFSTTLDATYTEPIGKNDQLQFSITEGYTQSLADKATDNFSDLTNDYTDKDSTLSSELQSSYLTTRPSLRYRGSLKEGKINYFAGLAYEHALLRGFQYFPADTSLSRNFHNILPSAMLRIQFNKGSNLRVFYRTYTSAPTANQLQNVVDNSNPLFLSAGNPALQQSYSHFLAARLTLVNPKNARSFFTSLMVNYTDRYIGNSTLIAARDTALMLNGNSLLLNKGAQLSQSVNLKGFYSITSVISYSLPIQKIKSNLNFNLTPMLNQIPSLINGEENLTQNLALGGGFVWGSNISEKVDFTLSYHGNYNFANNRLRPTLNNQYFNQVSSLRFNWLFGKGFVLNASAAHSLYTGMSDGFNQQFLLLNGSFGYKFLKNKSAEINITVFDALGQNAAISRNVNDIYVEDLSTQVLTRYVMLNFIYTLRAVNAPAKGDNPHGMPPHGHGGGMRPPH